MDIANASYADDDIKCSSYDAIYKPQKNLRDSEDFRMTISRDDHDDDAFEYNYHNFYVTKFRHGTKEPEFKLSLRYSCTVSSAQICTLGAGTNGRGKPISLTPEALNKDFSPAFFISKSSAPYALILGNAGTEFHYKGMYISDDNLKFFGEQKNLFWLPKVWIFSRCVH